MTLYQVLCLLGVPSLIALTGKHLFSSYKRTKDLKLAIQALLRAQMINDWNKWSELDYAPIDVKDSFENCWKQYHSLGVNGVMDDIHKKFMALSTSPPKED